MILEKEKEKMKKKKKFFFLGGGGAVGGMGGGWVGVGRWMGGYIAARASTINIAGRSL